MILFLYALGGMIVGALGTVLFVLWANRRAEHEEFKRFWGP